MIEEDDSRGVFHILGRSISTCLWCSGRKEERKFEWQERGPKIEKGSLGFPRVREARVYQRQKTWEGKDH
ncbi:hypothetical protein TNCV_1307641 [Trichonephila clavipes]|nr:hypothetical protein TNCV_1307641 [Trichonephila clavipes]